MWITSMGNHGAAGGISEAGVLVVLVDINLNYFWVVQRANGNSKVSPVWVSVLPRRSVNGWQPYPTIETSRVKQSPPLVYHDEVCEERCVQSSVGQGLILSYTIVFWRDNGSHFTHGPCQVHVDEGLTHWYLDKLAAISQTTFSNAFSWMKSFVFLFEFHWSLFQRVQLTISQDWFR